MTQTILTPTMINREAGRVLHQKANFIGTIDRQYESKFAQTGAKIGTTLGIRLPNKYSVRTGKNLDAQDTQESSVTLTVATQKGVDLNFSTAELTMSIQDFSSRIIEPAMSVLVANIENDCLSMYKDVYQEVSDVGATMSYTDVLKGGKKLTDSLCPTPRTLMLTTQNTLDIVSATASLHNDPTKVSAQYREGKLGDNFFGFKSVYENTMMPLHTTGTDDGTGDYLTNYPSAISNGATTLAIDTGAGTWKQGDIFQIESCYAVHPETKVSTGKLMTFVVTADYTSGGSLSISPAIYTSGAYQNVTGFADGKALYKRESDESTAIGNAADYYVGLGYFKDAFAIVTADLEMPDGSVDFKAREVMDGISIRIVRQYSVNTDNQPCRLDILYGYKTVRPEMAVRFGFN